MTIKVKLYGDLREKNIQSNLDMGLPSTLDIKIEEICTVLDILDKLGISKKEISHIFVNNKYSLPKKEIKNGIITKGMVPKVEACVYAVKNKCPKAHLLNGLIPHSILLEIFTDKGIGTEIVYENGH